MSAKSHRRTANHVVIPEKPTTPPPPPPAPKSACDCGRQPEPGDVYQWAWALRHDDIIRPCRDEQAARAEVARFPADRVLVRRRVGPWEVAGAVPAPTDTEGPGER